MRLRCTISFEYDVTNDEAERAEAYPGVSDDEVIVVERELVGEDPGYVLTLDVPWRVTVEKVPDPVNYGVFVIGARERVDPSGYTFRADADLVARELNRRTGSQDYEVRHVEQGTPNA